MDPITRDNVRCNFHLAPKTVQAGVTTARANSSNKHWRKLYKFTAASQDKVPFFHVFAICIRLGKLALNQKNTGIHGQSLEDYIRPIGQMSLVLGGKNFHYTDIWKMDFWLTRMWSTFQK